MKTLKKLIFASVITLTLNMAISCKGKTDNSSSTTVVDSPAVNSTAPVVISGDDDLRTGVADAVKDYPSVKADVSDGIINLTGNINRSDWQKLNPTLNSLHPKKVNSSNLTIQ